MSIRNGLRDGFSGRRRRLDWFVLRKQATIGHTSSEDEEEQHVS
jgi:hypothetical protein